MTTTTTPAGPTLTVMLARAGRQCIRAEANARKARVVRNALVRDAVDAGIPYRLIATSAEISPALVVRIVKGGDE